MLKLVSKHSVRYSSTEAGTIPLHCDGRLPSPPVPDESSDPYGSSVLSEPPVSPRESSSGAEREVSEAVSLSSSSSPRSAKMATTAMMITTTRAPTMIATSFPLPPLPPLPPPG